MAITQVTFDLSLKDPETDEPIKANVYTVEGVKDASGNLRQLSIGQLVMAICLQRASQLETEIIAMMKEMEETSEQLEELSSFESKMIENFESKNKTSYTLFKNEENLLLDAGVITSGQTAISSSITSSTSTQITYDDFITKIEAKMDEKNSFSQQTMIELQSKTNKRDQSYDMVSNILKSLNTTMTGNVNNM